MVSTLLRMGVGSVSHVGTFVIIITFYVHFFELIEIRDCFKKFLNVIVADIRITNVCDND